MHNIKRKVAFLLAGVMVAGTLSATPFYKGEKIFAATQKVNENLIPNGNFDTVTDKWGYFTTNGGEATVEQKDGALICSIDNVGELDYSVQANCGSGFALYQGGKYRLSFDVHSSLARDIKYCIQMNGGDYHSYVADQIHIDEKTQTVTTEFTMTDETDLVPALCFNMGTMDGDALDAHTITIDNVDLQLVDDSGIQSSGVEKQEENVNLIDSGSFDEPSSNWGNFTTNGGSAVVEQKDGALVCDIDSVGELEYSVQASCGSGFTLYQNGKYSLSFDISSTEARKIKYGIQMNGGDYRAYVSDEISIGKDVQRITIDFTMTDESDKAPALFFNMGLIGEDVAPHTIKIDNVDLELVDGSDIVYEEKEEQGQPINLNQVGYKPDAKKIAVFRGAEEGTTFQVKNAEDDSVVYEGTIGASTFNKATGEKDASGDFSAVTDEGSYYIEVEGLGKSYPFEIGDKIYDSLFKDAFRFFYLQRAEELPESLAGKFAHPADHTALARIYGTNDFIDVSGGWHDAGDYGRYVVATSKAVADLLAAYDSNKDVFQDNFNIPESGNGQSDMLDEIHGQLEWMLKMQNKENGGVYHKVTCANFPPYVTADQETDEMIVSPISTTATGDFAAVMAMGYEEFKETEPEFAETCLAAAKKAYDYLVAQPAGAFTNPEGIVTGEYGDANDSDERYWAAAALYKATGESKYDDAFKAYVAEGVKVGYDWANVGNYGNSAYLQAKNQDEATVKAIKDTIIEQADELLAASKTDGYGISLGTDYYWGSNMTVLNNASILMDAYRISGNEEYVEYAKEHVNYVLGKNSLGTSYVTAHGDVSPLHPHHRPSIVAEEAIPGALVGGPNKKLEDNFAKAYLSDAAPAKCWIDNQESYSTNEVDIYWSSTLVRSLAEMDFVDGSQQVSNVGVETKVSTQTSSNSILQTYLVTINKDEPIDTSKLSIRYYFNKKDAEEMNFVCDYAGITYKDNPYYQNITSSIQGEFVKTNAGYYMDVKPSIALQLAKDDATLMIQTRIFNENWKNFDSLSGEKMVVFYDGKPIK